MPAWPPRGAWVWSPAGREITGRHGGMSGITYNDEATGSSPGTPTPPNRWSGHPRDYGFGCPCWLLGLRAVVGPSGSHARTG